MPIDPWLPIGHDLGAAGRVGRTVRDGLLWQIVVSDAGERALLVTDALASRWVNDGLIEPSELIPHSFGARKYSVLRAGSGQVLAPLADAPQPGALADAVAFAKALCATRKLDANVSLQDAIFVERVSRLLPTYSISSRTGDDVVLGFWLSGGVPISVTSFRRLEQLSLLTSDHLRTVIEAAGFVFEELEQGSPKVAGVKRSGGKLREGLDSFALPGRPALEAFFNEHVVDVLRHEARYKAMGIGFPSAIVLQGPPGCGKTFAVDRLIDFLDWPRFEVDAGSVASPFIHDTSKKISALFDAAIAAAPSVLVIDEMDAFLASRDAGSWNQHRVEEVAEFLRRIPEAVAKEVLIIAMTNRIDAIDPAILRRGRFDHIIEVGQASKTEVRDLLDALLSKVPLAPDVQTVPLAASLSHRPLSDVAFVVREGARLASRAGLDRLNQASLVAALAAAPARGDIDSDSRVGFI